MYQRIFSRTRRNSLFVFIVLSVCILSRFSVAQSTGKSIYDQISAFALNGGQVSVTGLTLKRDRVTMTFTGTFYFGAVADGRVTGAVFLGQGTFKAPIPPSQFEKNNVKRLLNAEEAIESDFKSAVLRFSDDTFDTVGKSITTGDSPPQAQKLASDLDARILEETGANLSSRVALSLLNSEQPGFFFANFDGGKLDRFSFVFDAQNRIPTNYFKINGGEKGLIFSHKSATDDNDVWMAFYALDDYSRGVGVYSDVNDLVDIKHYDMNIDLRSPKSSLSLSTRVQIESRVTNLRAVPFTIGESLGGYDNTRLKKQLRVKSASLGTIPITILQENWEGGFLAILPRAFAAGEQFELGFDLEGDFLQQPEKFPDCSYPRSNSSWYPRHGYLDRATFNISYIHPKRFKVTSIGTRTSEGPDPTNPENVVTKYEMKAPVALVTFALGPFERKSEMIKWDNGDQPTPLEFNSLTTIPIKESFIMAEMNNSVRYFHALFGAYPYETFSGTFHPFAFGQGFPSMLMIPATDDANKYTYSFISHETAHQWWGNIVVWRSYRDQWLSEGFAEYSGILYTSLRQNPKAAENLINEMRAALKGPPQTLNGQGKGKLAEVGPIILGHRLDSSKTYGAYEALIYKKGALVLRMLHFLFTDPVSGNGQPFFDMMKDFVTRYRNKTASTDDFRKVANEHFVRTPIAKEYRLSDLDWFFQQWVYETYLPSYSLEYHTEAQPDGSILLTGNVIQENVPDNFFMPLPLYLKFGGDKVADATVLAMGQRTPFKLKLPMAPTKVELDPRNWVLSEKTITK